MNVKSKWLPSVADKWLEWRCGKGACAVCRSFKGLYEPGTEPKLPPRGCKCPGGCKCKYVAVPYPPKKARTKRK